MVWFVCINLDEIIQNADNQRVRAFETIEPFGCDYPDIEGFDKDSSMLLDFHFIDVAEVHMPHVDLWTCEYIYEIEISKDRGWIECWFNGFCMRVASKRLQVDEPRIVKKDK